MGKGWTAPTLGGGLRVGGRGKEGRGKASMVCNTEFLNIHHARMLVCMHAWSCMQMCMLMHESMHACACAHSCMQVCMFMHVSVHIRIFM